MERIDYLTQEEQQKFIDQFVRLGFVTTYEIFDCKYDFRKLNLSDVDSNVSDYIVILIKLALGPILRDDIVDNLNGDVDSNARTHIRKAIRSMSSEHYSYYDINILQSSNLVFMLVMVEDLAQDKYAGLVDLDKLSLIINEFTGGSNAVSGTYYKKHLSNPEKEAVAVKIRNFVIEEFLVKILNGILVV